MKQVFYEDDKVRIGTLNDNGITVESKISDPAEISVAIAENKVESNIGKVRFDLVRQDGVHEEYAYIMGRLAPNKQDGALYFAVRKHPDQQAREVLYIDPYGITSQVPLANAVQGATRSILESGNKRVMLAAQDDDNLVLYLNGKAYRAVHGLPPDQLW